MKYVDLVYIGSRDLPKTIRFTILFHLSQGISTFDVNTTYSAEYLKPVLDYAANIVPKDKHRETPLYILATAGMRLIDGQ